MMFLNLGIANKHQDKTGSILQNSVIHVAITKLIVFLTYYKLVF
jgi:hypothetical protein